MIVSGQEGCFDDSAILAMAIAYDRACTSLQVFGNATTVREIVAKRIIEVARQGERDPNILHRQALTALVNRESRQRACSIGR